MGTSSPETLRLRLPIHGAEAFVQAWAAKVEHGCLLLPTRRHWAPGTLVRFELQDIQGERLLLGEGEVSAHAPAAGRAGVLLKVTRMDALSRDRWKKIRTLGAAGAPAAGVEKAASFIAPASELSSRFDLKKRSKKRPGPGAPRSASFSEGRSPTEGGAFTGGIPATEAPILGIDLGTCRVLAAVADGQGVRCLPLDKAGRGLPAVVASGRGGELLVGAPALARRLARPGESIFGSKRLLGQRFFSPAVQRISTLFPYVLVPDEAGGVGVKLAAQSLSVTEVNARILEAVKASAQLALGQPVHRAVISVPAFLGDPGRAAVRQAGRDAGLEVLRIISEPTAAALAYGHGKKMPGKRVLVFDLGGGTFDVSLLTISGDHFEVVGTGGDLFLGGLDFDRAIVEALLAVILRSGGPEAPGPAMLERLLAEAEKVKIALSTAKRTELKIDALWERGDGRAQDLMLEISRDDLEDWVAPLIERCVALTLATLDDHGLSADQLDEVLLVGAQTRMPLLRARLAEGLGIPVEVGADPEQAVALGCALVARSIQEASDPRAAKVELQDVLGLDIGIALPDGRIAPVIERGTKIPCKRTVRLATREAGRRSLEVAIFQGNVRSIEHADYLGTMRFVDLMEAPAGEVLLVMVFELDGEGLLTIRAVDEAKGHELERLLSTTETPEEVREQLGRSSTVIHDLANLMPGGRRSGREPSGLFRGIKKLFGGGA